MTTPVSPTASYNVATENLPGGDIQRIKIVVGPENFDDGDVSSGNAMPVTEYSPTGLPNVYSDIFGVVSVPAGTIVDPTALKVAGVSGGTTPTDSRNGLQVNGCIDHGDADNSLKPIVIGSMGSKAVPGTVDDGDIVRGFFDLQGRTITAEKAATSTVTGDLTVDVTTTSILNANDDRLGVYIYNYGGTTVYVKLGTTASATSFTHKMPTDTAWAVPFGYTGKIDGISPGGAGKITVTEIT